MNIAYRTAGLLLIAALGLAMQSWAAQPSPGEAVQGEPAARDAAPAIVAVKNVTPAAASKKAPRAKSKAEYDAYQSAVSQTDPARLEVAATQFAQRFPASELRPFLFQRALGLYQQANNPAKALEMARAVLKYDPANPVALVGAAQLLAEGAHDHDLDRNARLQEAAADAELALQHTGELTQPSGLGAGDFESMIIELRGEAHEVLATVAYKRRDFHAAIDEYNAAVAGEKEHTGPVLWLRLAAAHEKLGEYSLGIAATQNALAASEAGGEVRELAEKELVRLKALAAEAASKPAAAPIETPAEAPAATANESQSIEKTENSRSPAASE